MTWDMPMPREYYMRRLAELPAEMEYERFEILVKLVAQLCRTKSQSLYGYISDEVRLFDDAAMRWLAERDPVIFVTACEDQASALQNFDINPAGGDTAFLQALLRRCASPPNRRTKGGDNIGRDVLLIAAMSALLHIDGHSKSAAASALELYDRIYSKMSIDHAHKVPDPERIRQIWVNKNAFLSKVAFPMEIDLLGSGWSARERGMLGIEWEEVLGANRPADTGYSIDYDAL